MTMYHDVTRKCAICGREQTEIVCSSSSCFGYSNLDYRLPSYGGYMFYENLRECRHCGFISRNIESEKYAKAYKELSNTESFIKCDGIPFKSKTAKKFYRLYLLTRKVDASYESAFSALRDVAWVCDDKKDFKSACECRMLAIPILDELIKTHPERDKFILLKLDFLRRCERFDEVVEYKAEFADKTDQATYKYQRVLAMARDSKAHSYEEVTFLYDL